MRLSRVEIQGFKSFADRTVIKFDADIISIVGPNGCGKSNIADAIRWAMGEQSTKRLRAHDMENIVFSGSDTRGPMSMAEVSLYFNNDGNFDHPIFGSCGEISITRRYFQTNESEYLINNVPCRRKDITELLSYAGASSKIYSVVEQGRIGWIVISKPEEKRSLIEEAAGVSVYKSRIASIERKTEKTRINLQRISDVIREMESNLTHLRRQAQKAKRFKKYQDELMDLELHNASHRYLGFHQNRHAIDMALEALRIRKEETDGDISAAESDMELLAAEITEMDERMGRMQEELYAAQNESALLGAGIDRSRQDVVDLKGKVAAGLEEIDRVRVKRETCLAEIATLETKRQGLKSGIEAERGKLREITGLLEAMKEDQARLVAGHEESRQRLVELASRIAMLQAKRQEGEKNTGEIEGRLSRLGTDRSEAEQRISALDLEIRQKRMEKRRLEETLESQERERAELNRILAEKKEEISGQDGKIDAADEAILSLRSSIQGLESSLRKAKEDAECARAICSEVSSSLLADKIACAEGYEKALAAALEKVLDCVVVSDLDTALAWHMKLKQRRSMESSFIARTVGGEGAAFMPPLFEPGELRGIVPLRAKVTAAWDVVDLVDRLLANVFVVDDVAHAAALHRRTGGRATFVTTSGEMLTPQGAVLGNGRRLSSKLDRRIEARIEAETRELDLLTGRRGAMSSDRDAMRSAIKSTAAGLESLQEKIHETEKDLLVKQQEIDSASAELGSLTGLVAELNQKSDAAQAKKSETLAGLGEIDDMIPALQREVRALEEGQKAGDAKIDEVRLAIEEKMILMGSQRSSIESLDKEDVELNADLARLSRSRAELEERVAALEKEVHESVAKQGHKLAEIFLGGERSEEIRFLLKKLGRDMEELKNLLNDRKFKIREKETALRALRKKLEECEREFYGAQTSLITIQNEIDKISQNVRLRWRRELEEVVYDYHNRQAPDEGTDEKIEELTRILERMGPVNLLAIEDYQATEEKYQFYLKEKTDLEEAIEKFKLAITKMNREYKRRFLEAFEAINVNFKQIFPLLFCGGHAYLELLDPTKPLETGVEIKAQPPGKKLGNLEMMSGGEKALTAIAMIFSIFRFRPSPFCILDEVDAPLDEANVKRFGDMLRGMTGASQFILMTHSKLTMQNSDILYGVTMEEPGISKIMSTKIGKVKAESEPLTAVA